MKKFLVWLLDKLNYGNQWLFYYKGGYVVVKSSLTDEMCIVTDCVNAEKTTTLTTKLDTGKEVRAIITGSGNTAECELFIDDEKMKGFVVRNRRLKIPPFMRPYTRDD